MLILTKGPTHKIRLITDAAGDIEVSYSAVDKTGTGPSSYIYVSKGEPLPSIVIATTVDILAGLANTETLLRHLSAFNNHASQAVKCTLFEEDGTDVVTHAKVTLLPGEKLEMDANGVWTHYDSNMGRYVYVTSVNADNITAGTLADARLSANVALLNRDPQTFAGATTFTKKLALTNLAQLSALSVLGVAGGATADVAPITAAANDRVLSRVAGALAFGQLTAGMFPALVVPDAALSANVPLLNAPNVFTGQNTFNGAVQNFKATNAAGATAISYLSFQDSAGSERGFVGLANGSGSIVGLRASVSGAELRLSSNGGSITLDGVASTDFARLSQPVVTPNLSAAEVGYKGIPPNYQATNYTCVLLDADKFILGSGALATITIPSSASVPMPVGTELTFVNWGGAPFSIGIAGDTLYLAGTNFGVGGTRTLARGGIAKALKATPNEWIISGAGLT